MWHPKGMSWKTYLPAQLRNTVVALSEADIATELPLPLHGRVDQVLFNENTRVAYLVDTKTRKTARVFLKDIIQLSVYRVILDRNAKKYLGMPAVVSPVGYIRVPSPMTNKAQYIAVDLLGVDVVVQFALRYFLLREKGMLARPTVCASTAFCNSCEVRPQCPRWNPLPERRLLNR